MNEPRNRARKVTRKAGPPEATDQQPVFQAPSETPANGGGNDAPADAGANNGDDGDRHEERGDEVPERLAGAVGG